MVDDIVVYVKDQVPTSCSRIPMGNSSSSFNECLVPPFVTVMAIIRRQNSAGYHYRASVLFIIE